MNRRTACAMAAGLAFVLAGTAPSLAGDKQLQNVRGSVSYRLAHAPPVPLAPNAAIALADRTYTLTGNDSLAQVSLPDSSRILVGSNTKVQLAFFNQAAIASATFVVYRGRTRFTVEHPQGARANYTFQTPTATVSVRGTQGDIGVDADGTLRVNVYAVSDPALPVTVTTTAGQSFQVNAGQTLVAQIVNGVVQATVAALTQQIVDQYSPDFGLPTNWAQLKNQLIQKAQSQLPPLPAPPISIPGLPPLRA